jgi:membrane fusion protein (multidrug efflux system)
MKWPTLKEHFLLRTLRFAVCLGCGLLLLAGCQSERKAPPPAPVVEVVEVAQRDVPIQEDWVGTTDGLVNATIRAQVTGYLIRQVYKEGDQIKKGQTLFEIDPRPFEAALDQARGALAQQEAQYANARANLARIKPLAAEDAVSPKDLDDALSAELSARATVAAAKAAVKKASLDLEFTKITSPIEGIAGLATAQVGDLVGPAQGGELTTVSTVDPIKIIYTINEQAYLAYMRRLDPAGPGRTADQDLRITLVLADGTAYPHAGRLFAMDRQVDLRTGTLRVAALFPNPGRLLRPGQFVRVRVVTGTRPGALLVPQRAVTELQGGLQVAVIGPEDKVEIRSVKTGMTLGNLVVVDDGLKAGERVVAEGTQKVSPGLAVSPRPFAPPSGSPSASPAARE